MHKAIHGLLGLSACEFNGQETRGLLLDQYYIVFRYMELSDYLLLHLVAVRRQQYSLQSLIYKHLALLHRWTQWTHLRFNVNKPRIRAIEVLYELYHKGLLIRYPDSKRPLHLLSSIRWEIFQYEVYVV